MPVEVRFFATLIDFVGKRKLYVEKAGSVRELLEFLESQYSGFKKTIGGRIYYSRKRFKHRASERF